MSAEVVAAATLTKPKIAGVHERMGSNTAQIRVGRLLEIRAAAGYRTKADVDALFGQVGRELAKLGPTERHVTIVDWRVCPVMAPEAADYMTKAIQGTNAGTERSAAIANEDAPIAVLQFVRLIRDARLPDRKLFIHVDEVCHWLGEVLSSAERARLKAFLYEQP